MKRNGWIQKSKQLQVCFLKHGPLWIFRRRQPSALRALIIFWRFSPSNYFDIHVILPAILHFFFSFSFFPSPPPSANSLETHYLSNFCLHGNPLSLHDARDQYQFMHRKENQVVENSQWLQCPWCLWKLEKRERLHLQWGLHCLPVIVSSRQADMRMDQHGPMALAKPLWK